MEVHSTPSSPSLSHIPAQESPESVIPCVQGEFYSYRTIWTPERPLGYLMKCKANKNRPLSFIDICTDELDLVFRFRHRDVWLYSPNMANLRIHEVQDQITWIAESWVTPTLFEQIRRAKNGEELARVCRANTAQRRLSIQLTPDAVVALATRSGKYGLLHIKDLTLTSVLVEACHILL